MSRQRQTLNRGWLAMTEQKVAMGDTEGAMKSLKRISPPVERRTHMRHFAHAENTMRRLFEESIASFSEEEINY
jgi:hypothetical protein